MKRILVPTDFSSCAAAAADVAVDLAERHGAEVHLYTRVHVHPLWDQLPERTPADFPESFARISKAKKQFQKLRQCYQGRSPRLISSYSHGDLIQVLGRYIDQERIDLIVMGSHGQRNGVGGFLFGSNAQKIVKHAPCPVIVVRDAIAKPRWNNVIFASDFREEARASFEHLLRFTQPMQSQLHLVRISAPASFSYHQEASSDDHIDDFSRLGDQARCQIHDFGRQDLETGLHQLVQETKADLVAVAHYGKPSLKRIFTTGLAEALINRLDIPVMVLNNGLAADWYALDEPVSHAHAH